jgi:hypothetical protein
VKIRTAALAGALAAVAVPAGALAAKPATHPTHPTTPAATNAAKPTVTFVLHGTLTGYTAVNGTTNGSVSLTISGSNHVAKSLQKQTLTFAIAPAAKVQLHNGAPIAVGDRAVVKVRATKASAASLQSASSIAQLLDQGKVA